MIVFDDLDVTEKIRIYDRGIVGEESRVGEQGMPLAYRRTGDIWIPQFDATEALRAEAMHFVNCVMKGERPRVGGREGLHIVRTLEAAEQSMRKGGAPVEIEAE